MRDGCRLKQNIFSTLRYEYKFIKYYGAQLWNTLPLDVKRSHNLYIFKRKITERCKTEDCEHLIIF